MSSLDFALTFELKGMQELDSALQQFSNEVQLQILKKSNADCARLIRDEAKKRVLRDTGLLASRLSYAPGKKNLGKYAVTRIVGIRKVSGEKRKGKLQRTSGAPISAYYGKFWELEKGWTSRGGRHIPPKPFLRPALEQNFKRMVNMHTQHIMNLIAKYKAKFGHA